MRRGIGAAVLGLAGLLLMPHAASATPAFSRQLHTGCDTCHFQGMGALNAFGRAFMMNNFSLSRKMRQQLREKEKRERQKRKADAHAKGR